MFDKIKIYGVEINLPPVPDEIEDWGADIASEQYWRRNGPIFLYGFALLNQCD